MLSWVKLKIGLEGDDAKARYPFCGGSMSYVRLDGGESRSTAASSADVRGVMELIHT